MGNCGVGFAPCKPGDRDKLVELMEGVEDIPGTALHEGIQWDWETFPEYLDALERRALALENVLLPEVAQALGRIDEQLTLADQEEAVRIRQAARTQTGSITQMG